MNWHAKNGSGGQGLVIDETDGRTVAVVYDEKDKELLAAAPDLLAALRLTEDCLGSFNGKVLFDRGPAALAAARAAISKAVSP